MPERRTVQFKAWNASNSRAIAKFHNTEIGHFGHNAFIHELIRGSLEHLRIDEWPLDQYIVAPY
jgi:hypothetical protein